MTLGRYDKLFGGDRGAAEKALEAMKRTYGRKDGEAVFWGTIAKRKRRGERRRKRA
ncbi:MAG TPA: hypothetical protein VFI54_06305 [Solirubrobacteraceae bacterium]|nr:hypothetical protein [Solirubrobacteraceae bacterium]